MIERQALSLRWDGSSNWDGSFNFLGSNSQKRLKN